MMCSTQSNELRIRVAQAILGKGFQSGATVTFDGSATPATLDGAWLLTTAPPHPVGAIDIVVINPDGRTSRLEKAFTYVEDLLASGDDITIGPGDSVAATLGPLRSSVRVGRPLPIRIHQGTC
jgi:hypothetical protein